MRILLASFALVLLLSSCSNTDLVSDGGKFLTGQQNSSDANADSDFEIGENQKTGASAGDPKFGDGQEDSESTDDQSGNTAPSLDSLTEGEGDGEINFTEVESSVNNVLASRMDAVSALDGDGFAPYPIFQDVKFSAGDRLSLGSATGRSIYRVYGGQSSVMNCPANWMLSWKSASGQILRSDLLALDMDVLVPDEAVAAVLGYKDGYRAYFDNEGKRNPTDGKSTNGCNFTFKFKLY